MAVSVKHSTPADGTFSATGAAAWDADHNFTGTIDVTNGGTGANTLTANALLKGNGTSAVSASSITDNGSLVTIAEPVRLSTPSTSSAAWTTSGINLIQSAATFTDTTSTGTVADVRVNNFAAQTVAASNTITATNLYGTYFTAPIAGTNVTASNRWAVGMESLTVNGSLQSTSTVDLGTNTGTVLLRLANGTTASGSTKTVNIGTNGASGSTTNITLGSSTSGATSSITANGQVTLAPIGGSRAAWTTNGIGLIQSAATWTDTSSTGTVSQVRMNSFAAQTLAASNPITVTNLWGTYFTNPVAGTNVTASNIYALAADTFLCSGQFLTAGNVYIASTSGSVSANLAAATTASGSTKTVNIGTGGASGSTTNITLGSSTSGATQTTTVNGQVTLAPIGGSAAAWTTSGIALKQSAATWTDTSSTGTIADVRVNNFAAQTVAASNVITVTRLFGSYFTAPTAGTNVTATATYGIGADSIWTSGSAVIGGNIAITGFLSATGSTGTTTHSIGTATTSTGNTKTINIGTGGASGSTTNITIGSSTSGATSTTTLNGSTVCAGTIRMQGYTVATLPAAGTAGRRAYVTDATAPTFLGALIGGGTVVTPVFDNGTAWVAG